MIICQPYTYYILRNGVIIVTSYDQILYFYRFYQEMIQKYFCFLLDVVKYMEIIFYFC